MEITTEPIVWETEPAVSLIRELQPQTRNYHYHLALGGGVLNRGYSTKDLDLYFLPLDNGAISDFQGLLGWLERRFTLRRDFSPSGNLPNSHYRHKGVYETATGQRIDVFITGRNGDAPQATAAF